MVAKYLSKVQSLVIHSFSIWPAITFEYVFNMQFWTPIALNLWRPSNIASYFGTLLLRLSVSVVNCKHMTYLSLMPEGDIKITADLAPEIP
jgi:hypothetical protein